MEQPQKATSHCCLVGKKVILANDLLRYHLWLGMPNGITKRNILTHASFFVRDPAYINKKGGLVTQWGAHETTRSKKVNVN